MAKKSKNKNLGYTPKITVHDINSIDSQLSKLNIAKSLAIQKSLHSTDVEEIYKAQQYLQQIESRDKNVAPQSILIDPNQFDNNGYKNKSAFKLSYDMLRAMANVPIIKAIIETRKEQVCSFMEPQKDKYSQGFIIRPKKYKMSDSGIKLTSYQEERVEYLTNFILNCGNNSNIWHGDNIISFTRKFIADCLSMDQGSFEIIRDKSGEVCEFLAIDGSTIRLSDYFNEESNKKQDNFNNSIKKGEKLGYMPYYVQVYQGRILAEFYPWELCVGMRNPSSSIYSNGYGRSELEDLIENTTSLLNADQYNANYFKVGANPKGILKVNGANINPAKVDEMRNHWQATMAGVKNAHKLMVVDAEKMDFISTQQSNKDMEYGKYQEFLIKIACAHYKIDPSEIGFSMSGSSTGSTGLGGEGIEEKITHSKDKGLKPLVKFYFNLLNNYIINQLDPDYEIVPGGLDVETPAQELENDVKAVTNWATINEIRRKRGMADIEGGDIICNPMFLQSKMMDQQNSMQNQSNQYMDEEEDKNKETKKSYESNPLVDSLVADVERLLTEI